MEKQSLFILMSLCTKIITSHFIWNSGSQSLLEESLGPETFSGGLQDQNYFHNNTKDVISLFYYADISSDGIKAMADKTAGTFEKFKANDTKLYW